MVLLRLRVPMTSLVAPATAGVPFVRRGESKRHRYNDDVEPDEPEGDQGKAAAATRMRQPQHRTTRQPLWNLDRPAGEDGA